MVQDGYCNRNRGASGFGRVCSFCADAGCRVQGLAMELRNPSTVDDPAGCHIFSFFAVHLFFAPEETVQQLSTISNTVLLVPYTHTTSKSRKHTSKNPQDITQRRKGCYHSLRPGVFAFSLFWFTSATDNKLAVKVVDIFGNDTMTISEEKTTNERE